MPIAILASTFSTFLSALVLRSLHPLPPPDTCILDKRFANSSSVIDLTILNNFHYTYDIASISELSSDHNPVLLNFNVNYITLNIPLKVSTNWKTFTKTAFSDHSPVSFKY
ncbi:hypothetical protein CEXT_154201 [Caerostris extrusa]|uniref:Endonuclease/exonuclease/phosphatase domain-containing protein n=1 Tax=Caerostris extrusa TaxID=172846 RepID=A0AAV4X4M5_CAEEX|nr:hypothetical protein CEXT_154201 [Caerostris extrusa]